MTQTALIIGATGGIGGQMAEVLLSRGWKVRALNRNPKEATKSTPHLKGVEWIKGDAMNKAEVVAAAQGVDLVFHGANPPGYRNWKGLALPLLESSIAAAQSAGARLAFPGTVYNFAPDTFPLVAEDAPQKPLTRKGSIRVEMEKRLEHAASEGTQVIILRAGDFFGPRGTANSWFGQGIAKPGKPLRVVAYPGAHKVGHDWAYLPDLAETFMRLIERADELPAFARFHFEGHWFDEGVEIARATARVAGISDTRIKSLPWWAIYLAAPFVETFRELIEMRYLWKKPLRLDNRKLVAFLGVEPHTPTDLALRQTLAGLGSLPATASAAPRALALSGKV